MLNNYVRGAQVGQGQHGAVYQGWDNTSGREVAIKAVKRKNIKAEKMKMLRRSYQLPASPHTRLTDRLGSTEQKIRKEIAIMKKCRHPHVVELLDVIDDNLNEKIYMVMEFLGGGELRWRDGNDRPILHVDQSRRICRDVLLGLEYLHYQGIIHRDIKPANLLWTADRRAVKITDFGVSHFSYMQRLAAAGRGQAALDDPYDPILLDDSDLAKRAGTPPFLAPEIVSEYNAEPPQPISSSSSSSSNPVLSLLRTSRPASPVPATPPTRPPITKAIDVWALGVTLFCLLFGHTPFSTPHGEYVLYNIICNQDWDVPCTMGSDAIPTGSRHSQRRGKLKPEDEPVRLLDRLLQKDPRKRITLDEAKRSPWFLRDIPNAAEWLRETSPQKDELVIVSDSETIGAVSAVSVQAGCCAWSTRLARRFSALLRGSGEKHYNEEETFVGAEQEQVEPPSLIKANLGAMPESMAQAWQDKVGADDTSTL